MRKKSVNQKGFTVLELLIATTVFSVVLLLCVYGLMSIGNTYYKGVLSSRTQTTVRNITDNISQTAQYAGAELETFASGNTGVYCYGKSRYSFQKGLNNTYLNYDEPTSCDTLANVPYNAPTKRELLPSNMRLSDFEIIKNTNVSRVRVKITAGDADLFVGGDPVLNECNGGYGSQFCSVAILETIVTTRINL